MFIPVTPYGCRLFGFGPHNQLGRRRPCISLLSGLGSFGFCCSVAASEMGGITEDDIK